MRPDLYWIPSNGAGRLAIAARPRGGDWLEDEVLAWRRTDIDLVVSLLEPEEEDQLGLTREGELVQANGLSFLSFPIVDRSVPLSLEATLSLLTRITAALDAGQNVAIHCRQGIGRSGMVAAGVLILAGIAPDAAMETVTRARGLQVPETPDQVDWLKHLPSIHLVNG